MTFATGVAKQLRYKKESAWATAPGASGAQLLRRVTSDLNLAKDTYQSNEIRSDYQFSDFRHGVRRADGSIRGEMSVGTYADFLAAALRKNFAAGATTGALTNVTAAATDPQFTRSAGSYLADGFKLFDVVRWGGFAGGSAPNNNTKNFLITALTATQMTGVFLDGSAVVADAAGDSVTCTVTGKKTFAPLTGHTDDSFYIEHWHSDINVSEQYAGCKVNTLGLDLPPTGMATIEMALLGKTAVGDTSAYYSSPAAETTTGVLAAVQGQLRIAGAQQLGVTGVRLNIDGGYTPGQVVGSNAIPAVFPGRIHVTGEFSCYFESGAFRDYFWNETEISLAFQLLASGSANADLLNIVIPRLKVGGAALNDGEQGLVRTFPFEALLNGAGGAGISSEKTTISIQDTSI